MKKILFCSVLALNAGLACASNTASWTLWNTSTATGTFVQNSNNITVTFTGYNYGFWDTGAHIFNAVPSSFTSADVSNTPDGNGTVDLTGGYPYGVNNFHFSQAVTDPLVALWSVGQWSVPVTFNFLNNPIFSITSQGGGSWGGGILTQTGDSVTGWEGNGLLEFKGTYTDISFTTPNPEYYYGATVGAISNVSAPVPEPETYATLMAGLGLLSVVARRRKQNMA